MKRRRLDLSALVPPGYNWKKPLYRLLAGWGLGLLDGLYFLVRWGAARSALYRAGALRPDAAVFLLADLAAFFAYERRGARGDYTLRRLPQRFERLRRLAALPALMCLATLLLGFLLLLSSYLVYMNFTPPSCIQPGQWAKIWRF